jgi:hypothetical protein
VKNRVLTRQHIENRYAHKAFPKLLVVKEKHGEEYYLINDIDALLRAALAIVLRRHEEGYWYHKPEKDKLKEEVAEDVLVKLPSDLYNKAMEAKQYNIKAEKRFQQEMVAWEMIQKAVNEKDGVSAFQVIDDRKDHEYETWYLENLKIP